MNNIRVKSIILAVVMFLNFIEAYASEAKGYKIVLASFPTFDEAKAKLNDLSQNIGDAEKALQKRYGFEIAARPSGKAYMLAIEPFQTEKDAQEVLKTFKHFYPDSYINGYFGPTKGAVFLNDESLQPDVNQTLEDNTSTVAKPIPSVQSQELVTPIVQVKEEPSHKVWILISVLGIAVLGLLGWFLKGNRKHESLKAFKERYEETISDEDNEDRVEVIESEAYSEVEESEISKEVGQKQFEPESDIFFKLKKNTFFMSLMGELKSAADNKDYARCSDLLAELMRYQKNFKKSVKMDILQQLVDKREFERLATFINNEME